MGPFSPDQKLGATILSHSPWILRLIIAVSRLTRCKVFQVQSVTSELNSQQPLILIFVGQGFI
jgi:hypothetical protein